MGGGGGDARRALVPMIAPHCTTRNAPVFGIVARRRRRPSAAAPAPAPRPRPRR